MQKAFFFFFFDSSNAQGLFIVAYQPLNRAPYHHFGFFQVDVHVDRNLVLSVWFFPASLYILTPPDVIFLAIKIAMVLVNLM